MASCGRVRTSRTAEAAVGLATRHLVQPWPLAGSIGAEARSFIGEGDGIYITDGDGRRLIDGPAGMWCVNVGHRRRELAEVMAEQAMALSYNTPWYTMNAPSAVLAERLAAHAPGDLDHVFFTTGGSSAVETALRFMQFYNNVRGRPEKKLIVSRGGAYHGSTYLSASLNGRPRDRDWMDAADELVVKLSSPDPFRRPAGMSLEAFSAFLVGEFEETVARLGAERIGAFVGEPIQASGGVIVPPPGYLAGIRKLCRDNDILFVSDEVVTGFGRLGEVFASETVFGIDPDIVTFAKGVTSGYFPLGGMMVSARLMEELRRSNHPDAMFGHGLTYSSHPVGCAVALKNLDLLEDGVLDHARKRGALFPGAAEDAGGAAAGRRGARRRADGLRRMRRRPRQPQPAGARQECRPAHRRPLPRARAAGAPADQHVRDVAAADHHREPGRRPRRHPARRHLAHHGRSAGGGALAGREASAGRRGMDTIEAIRGRRSIRDYSPRKVPRRLIERILDDAAQAPTPPLSGEHPFAFVVIEGQEARRRMRRAGLAARPRENRPAGPGYDWVERPGLPVFFDAPAAVVICGADDAHRPGDAGLQPRRPEPDAVCACPRARHLLGRLADALARHRGTSAGLGVPAGYRPLRRLRARLSGDAAAAARRVRRQAVVWSA